MTKQIQIAPLRGAFGIKFVIFESVFGHFENCKNLFLIYLLVNFEILEKSRFYNPNQSSTSTYRCIDVTYVIFLFVVRTISFGVKNFVYSDPDAAAGAAAASAAAFVFTTVFTVVVTVAAQAAAAAPAAAPSDVPGPQSTLITKTAQQ